MSLTDLASVGSFVSGLAVLISLIYLSQQIRQNTHVHRATAHQERLNFVKDFLARIADPSMAPLYLRGLSGDGEMSEVEFTQYRMLMHGWFLGMSEIVWLYERGVLDEERYAGSMEALRGYLRFSGCRAVWRVINPAMPTSFRTLVERFIAEGGEGDVHSAFASWRGLTGSAGVAASPAQAQVL
ncbi:MAG: hypothetical protein ACHP7N_12805 [Caulobacterales bacterium]